MVPEACLGADGAAGSWGMWAGGDSPAAGAASVGWGLQDAEAARAGLVVHPPAVVLFELALAGLVGAVLLVKLDTVGICISWCWGAIKSACWRGGRLCICGCCWTAVGW